MKKAAFTLTAVLVFLGISTASASALFLDTGFVERFDKDENAPLLSTTVVISQVYSGGGGSTGTYLNDYVEIKNISSIPQSLNGLSLIYGSATGQFGSAATLIFALPNTTLNPGQYFLVQTSGAGTAGVPLPVTPDATTTNLSMAGASGKVIIANSSFVPNTCGGTMTPCTLPNAGIIDLVAWGTSNNAEGGATVNNGVALTTTQGSIRKTAGCTETDNNNNDFDVVTAPVPRNTATTLNPCGPSAASVGIGGRVRTSTGMGLANVVVSVTDSNGNARTARTNIFGYFNIDGLEAGNTYVVDVYMKSYHVAPQVVFAKDEVTTIEFVVQE